MEILSLWKKRRSVSEPLKDGFGFSSEPALKELVTVDASTCDRVDVTGNVTSYLSNAPEIISDNTNSSNPSTESKATEVTPPDPSAASTPSNSTPSKKKKKKKRKWEEGILEGAQIKK